MSAHSYLIGFGGAFVTGSISTDVTKWTISVDAAAEDSTNTGDAGWESNITGCKKWSGTADTFFDLAQVPTLTGSPLLPGARGTVSLNVGSSGLAYTGSIQVTNITYENPAKNICPFNLTYQGTGPLTYPT